MMPSVWQIAIIIMLFIIVFGAGRIPKIMSDVAKGINEFKKGIGTNKSDNQD